MASAIDEAPSANLTASVMHELDAFAAGPPEDEYATVHEQPPAYDSFEHAYASWNNADQATQAIAAIDRDPDVIAAEKMLIEAKETLKEMKKRRCCLLPDLA